MLLDIECIPTDLAFIIDSSDSIGSTNWARNKRFITLLISKLKIGNENIQISAIAYSTEPEVVLRFNSPQIKEEVIKKIEGMEWQRGFTYTDKALLLADSELFTASSGMRPTAAKVSK